MLRQQGTSAHPLGDPDHRWGFIAVLRQAIIDLESGQHVAIVEGQLERALAVVKAGIEA